MTINKEYIPKLILIIPNKDVFEICDPKDLDLKDIVDVIKNSFKSMFENDIRIVFLWVGAHDTINAQKSRNELKGEPLRWTTDIFNRKQMDNFKRCNERNSANLIITYKSCGLSIYQLHATLDASNQARHI